MVTVMEEALVEKVRSHFLQYYDKVYAVHNWRSLAVNNRALPVFQKYYSVLVSPQVLTRHCYTWSMHEKFIGDTFKYKRSVYEDTTSTVDKRQLYWCCIQQCIEGLL